MLISYVGGDVLLHHLHVVVAPVQLPLLTGVVDADQQRLGLASSLCCPDGIRDDIMPVPTARHPTWCAERP